MVLTPAFFAQVRGLIQNAPKTPIPKGPNRIPNPQAWKPRDEALLDLLAGEADLQAQISALAPVVAPARRLYLTKNANDPYGGDLATAISAALALNPPPSPADPVVIEILSPGTYEGNVTLVPGLYLVSLSCAPGDSVMLSSSSGVTLTLPEGSSGVQGVNLITTSAAPADAAVEVIAGGVSDQGSFLILLEILAPNGATALRSVPGTSQLLPLVVAGVTGNTAGPAVDLQGAGLFAIFGFFNNNAGGTAVLVTNGAFIAVLNALCSIASGSAGWLFDVDGGALIILGQVQFFETSNVMRGRNGAFLILNNVSSFSNPTGSALDLDGTSVAVVGDEFLPFPGSASAYTGWVGTTTANVAFKPSQLFEVGTTVPDTRPPAPRPGMLFFATDRVAGTQNLTFIPGTGWVDQAGTVVP